MKYWDRIKDVIRSIALVGAQKDLLDKQSILINHIVAQLTHVTELLNIQAHETARLQSRLNLLENFAHEGISATGLVKLSDRVRRNFLPNDSALMQKMMMQLWQLKSHEVIGFRELVSSGFRVFSQNDEDGILLRIFTQIGIQNNFVLEIGSNCSDSDIGIPENLSTNLIVNHGWHGAVFEIDSAQCEQMRYFFARDLSTKHFHVVTDGNSSYFSPLIMCKEITPKNINQLLAEVSAPTDLDLMIIDIDGGDFEIIRSMTDYHPRVLVVEFEKRFGAKHAVVQYEKSAFSQKWPQSGAASLSAWEKLLKEKGYVLCAIGTCGFNAFFVSADIVEGKIEQLDVSSGFDEHTLLSKVSSNFWLDPDDTWVKV